MFAALTPYMTYIKLAILAAVFAAGVGTGIHREQPKIAALNQTIGASAVTITNLTAAVDAQNKGINELKLAATIRAKDAKAALDVAQSEAVIARRTAADILATKAPKGVNRCLAAEQAFRAELRNERGIK